MTYWLLKEFYYMYNKKLKSLCISTILCITQVCASQCTYPQNQNKPKICTAQTPRDTDANLSETQTKRASSSNSEDINNDSHTGLIYKLAVQMIITKGLPGFPFKADPSILPCQDQ